MVIARCLRSGLFYLSGSRRYFTRVVFWRRVAAIRLIRSIPGLRYLTSS